ncbi:MULTISPECIES: helix-turn-helix domain-containing protein [unclassified Streptomyces]|uniref:helix-turn-helix domain-containing protein n=1 Tax=unclassified Streptomyces TaxID=2593676 RepID=UPI00380341D9
MQNLSQRLAAVDASAGRALDVIAYFDRLAESRAGLETVVRGAAVLCGVPAGLVDPGHRILIRVLPDGTRQDADHAADPRWRSAPASLVPTATLWLETERDGDLVDDMVLERATMVAGLVITRVRGVAPIVPERDCALTETVLDPRAAPDARISAARRLGLTERSSARVLAFGGCERAILLPGVELPTDRRIGVGPVVPARELPRSAELARTALRFAAEGTPEDPGPRAVHADDLGTLLHLAAAVGSGSAPSADLTALDQAAAEVPWLVPTLTAYTAEGTVRATATALYIHHSTLQDRLHHAERLLGWPLRTPEGRLRVHLTLMERRLIRSGRD